VDQLARALYLRGQLTLADEEAVTSVSRVGEHCRHNGQPPMPADEVRAAIAGVRELLTGHPLR
jgi:hypothetical protein